MKNAIASLLDKYGSTISVEGSDLSFKGFLQPLLPHKNSALYSVIGEVPQGRFLFLGPLSPAVFRWDVLILNGEQYELERVEAIMQGNEELYRWGTCRLKGRDTPWN